MNGLDDDVLGSCYLDLGGVTSLGVVTSPLRSADLDLGGVSTLCGRGTAPFACCGATDGVPRPIARPLCIIPIIPSSDLPAVPLGFDCSLIPDWWWTLKLSRQDILCCRLTSRWRCN